MNIKNYLRRKLIKITGYYFYKYSDLEIGTDFERDLILKLNTEVINIKQQLSLDYSIDL